MSRNVFVCQSCGSIYPRWYPRCEACNSLGTLTEEAETAKSTGKSPVSLSRLHDETVPDVVRKVSGWSEFDRVCGGGLVPGSVLLIGGSPGIGKSTLLLQLVGQLSGTHSCVYISGEESVDQIRLRAGRLDIQGESLYLATETDVQALLATIETQKAEIFVIDSIQTMYLEGIGSASGTVSQVRACAQALITAAKRHELIVLMVGHVTKDGLLAGPRVLEHMVDTVFSFEGDPTFTFRILRSLKNRFGPTDEIGLFEMTDHGLRQVLDPCTLFLSEHYGAISGTVVFAGLEGTRPLLVEIQALIAPSSLVSPRRAVVGWDSARLGMLLAVLETRCGISFASKDVYLNVVGGIRITEPAADLAVAAALLSSLRDIPLPADTVIFGEIGLSGEVRMVNSYDQRLKEAATRGFSKSITPPSRNTSYTVIEMKHINDLRDFFHFPPKSSNNTQNTMV